MISGVPQTDLRNLLYLFPKVGLEDWLPSCSDPKDPKVWRSETLAVTTFPLLVIFVDKRSRVWRWEKTLYSTLERDLYKSSDLLWASSRCSQQKCLWPIPNHHKSNEHLPVVQPVARLASLVSAWGGGVRCFTTSRPFSSGFTWPWTCYGDQDTSMVAIAMNRFGKHPSLGNSQQQ